MASGRVPKTSNGRVIFTLVFRGGLDELTCRMANGIDQITTV